MLVVDLRLRSLAVIRNVYLPVFDGLIVVPETIARALVPAPLRTAVQLVIPDAAAHENLTSSFRPAAYTSCFGLAIAIRGEATGARCEAAPATSIGPKVSAARPTAHSATHVRQMLGQQGTSLR